MIDFRAKYATVFSKSFDISPPFGWEAIVDRAIQQMLDAIDPAQRDGLRVSQIKEKFATLRIYHNGDAEIEAFVEAADEEARRTCQMCGKPGIRHGGNFIAVLCGDHMSLARS